MASKMLLVLTILSPLLTHSACPFLLEGTPPFLLGASVPDSGIYNAKLSNLNIASVFKDINQLLTDTQDCWPADSFSTGSSYGPLFVRLSWHCAGTYRADGVGGCGGGRSRFSPEASWADNTNLDKARALLAPIKSKYGDALSWGDLLIFAGTASILSMGGPVTEVCAGRIDEGDGSLSEPLIDYTTCPEQGNCQEPLGADTIGLIYVNPEGVMGVPHPNISATRIREIFGRMGMNDTETVALIGGGHAFGKSHGACPNGAGLPPNQAPYDPWVGLCGTGMGEDTYTSGIEGQWTTNPLAWDNEFFERLVHEEYSLTTGPGGKHQWINQDGFMMLTTDIALIYDDGYMEIVERYANDISELNNAFSAVWAKLTTFGGVWAENRFCVAASELNIEDDQDSSSSSSKQSRKKRRKSGSDSPDSSESSQDSSHSGSRKRKGKRKRKGSGSGSDSAEVQMKNVMPAMDKEAQATNGVDETVIYITCAIAVMVGIIIIGAIFCIWKKCKPKHTKRGHLSVNSEDFSDIEDSAVVEGDVTLES